ncbi:cytochrome p450 [Hirsutella rhossiliensis]|uniref:Cytochrome p450 domain-containing protein n=1 Tax=Hirsutella rhossiliensis TaxID=111463 RepID=A0A9P8MRW6_9HYPO|nr:cytochrome p450 domain-containing protein [Hirsutella rhossiliensis]KAH0959354.1 cytochrome p450 domain-containing protein [Hirsutella rhossiliensis]
MSSTDLSKIGFDSWRGLWQYDGNLLHTLGLLFLLIVAYGVAQGIYRIWFHPLSKFPGPLHLSLTSLPAAYSNYIQGTWLGHAFSDAALAQQEPVIIKYVDMMLDRLSRRADEGQSINIVEWLNFTTFDIIGDLVFSDSFSCLENNGYHPWVLTIFRGVQGILLLRFSQYYPLIGWIIGKSSRRSLAKVLLGARSGVKDKAKARLEHGPKPPGQHQDIIAYMMKKTRDGGDGMSESEVLACINEILRMYPPAAETATRVSPGDMVDGKFVPAGTHLSVYPWATFQNPANFVEAESYIPERWLPATHPRYEGRFAADKRAVFKPFSYGPRDCIGKNLAYSEMRLIICRLLYRFDFELAHKQESWHDDQKILFFWQKKPLYLNLQRRGPKIQQIGESLYG